MYNISKQIWELKWMNDISGEFMMRLGEISHFATDPSSTRCGVNSWWRHQVGTFSALLAICAGNLPVTGEFPAQRPVTRIFDFSLIYALNKRLSKQSWGWWFETQSRSSWRDCNVSPLQLNGRHFVDDIFICISVNENCVFWWNFHWRFFLRVHLIIIQHWFR